MSEREPRMYAYETFYQQQLDLIGQLRAEVEGLLHIADIRPSGRGDSVEFAGRLQRDAESVFNRLREPFRRLGYTPIMRRETDGTDIIVAQRGVPRISRLRPGLNVVLLGLTLLTTLFFGAAFADVNPVRALAAAVNGGQWEGLLEVLLAGTPFALSLLFILGVHEMGHFVAAKLHRVDVTLPYFIPVPFGLGTLGAFIQMKSPVENRKALFDVGLAGPLAGFVVAVPLMIFGLMTSAVAPAAGAGGALGKSLLVEWLVNVFAPHPAGTMLNLSPVAIAAWFGLLITGLNLLPMGQLDGGHIAYAVLGNLARPVATASFIGLLLLGWQVWSGWYTWAFFALITGLRHPQPLNDITPLDGGRRLLGFLTLILFFLLVTLRPF